MRGYCEMLSFGHSIVVAHMQTQQFELPSKTCIRSQITPVNSSMGRGDSGELLAADDYWKINSNSSLEV